MRTNFFFNGSWIAQLIVGFGLFFCSFYIEYQILIHFVSPQPMALFLAVTLEGGKVVAIIWHYYLGYLAPETYPTQIHLTSLVFRVGLFTLSLLCSMLFFTTHLDRPNLAAIRSGRITEITVQTQELIEQTREQYADRKSALLVRQQGEVHNLQLQHENRINHLEALLLKEMDNVVNGQFIGKRYKEFERQLEIEKTGRDKSMTTLQQQHTAQQEVLDNKLSDEFVMIRKMKEDLQNAAITDDFIGNDQVHDRRIVALLIILKSIFNLDMQPLQFVFLFSVLISLLMETGIMLSFATITMVIAPVLQARHIDALEKEALRVRTEGKAEQDNMRHRASMNRVRKSGRQVMDKANAVYNRAVVGA